jgi:hypothetical protein
MSHGSLSFIFALSLAIKIRAVWCLQILDAPMKYSEVNVHPKYSNTAAHLHNSIISQWNSHNFVPLCDRHLHQITLRTATDTSNVSLKCMQLYRLKLAVNWTALRVVPEQMSISYRHILTKCIMPIISNAIFFSVIFAALKLAMIFFKLTCTRLFYLTRILLNGK